ncbi:F0F1 ATP synthase subunit B [Xanthobacter sp. TB0136]|uniref:F0F1 ATP synthase subunit B n=1 Tax=Xanthobacter sp. TB0136 TaxID=3459177 RepID=UPI004039B584
MTVALAIAGIGLGATPLAAVPLVVEKSANEAGAFSPLVDGSFRVAQAAPVQAEDGGSGEASATPAEAAPAEQNAAPSQEQTQPAAVEAVEVEETVIQVQEVPAAAAAPASAPEHGNIVDEHAAHFPPFDVSTFPSQLLWLVITFVLLYLLMSRVTLPRIGRILEERRDRIADDLDEGIKLKAESEAAQLAYEKALNEARARANAIAGETRAKLAAESDANRKALEADLNAKLEAAEVRIAATKAEAMGHVRGIAVDTAQAIVASLVGASPSTSDVEKAVDTVLTDKVAA